MYDSVIIAASVFLSGVIGAFLLYLADKRSAENIEHGTSSKSEIQEATIDSGIAEMKPVNHWPDGTRLALIGGILIFGGAMAIFLHLFYHDTVINIINILLLCSVLWPCAWSDFRVKLIPNSVLLYGLLLRIAMLGAEVFLAPQEVFLDLARSGVAAAALFIVSFLCKLMAPGAIGFGDVKLLMLMGFFLGTDRVWGCVFFSMLISFVFSAVLLLTRRANMKTEIPYAPFLLLGTVTATFLVNV